MGIAKQFIPLQNVKAHLLQSDVGHSAGRPHYSTSYSVPTRRFLPLCLQGHFFTIKNPKSVHLYTVTLGTLKSRFAHEQGLELRGQQRQKVRLCGRSVMDSLLSSAHGCFAICCPGNPCPAAPLPSKEEGVDPVRIRCFSVYQLVRITLKIL